MDWLTNLFNFEDIQKKTDELLSAKYGKARTAAEGGFAGAEREGQANLNVANQRQGILGSGLASTLSSRLTADLARKKQGVLAGLDAAEASDTANLGIQNAMANNQAKAGMITGITGGIFDLLGTAAGHIFPPAKAV